MFSKAISAWLPITRRSGTDWFVGSLTNSTARDVSLKLDFLPEGTYTADIYADAPDVSRNPNHLTQQTRTVSRTDVLMLKLAADGG